MDFSVVESGYDRDEVDACLADLGEQLARASAQADAAADTQSELELVRLDADRLHELLKSRPAVYRSTFRIGQIVALAEEEAEEILAEARAALDNAKRDAERIRQEVYADAVNARRDFELALSQRRKRAMEHDALLENVRIETVPAVAPAVATAPADSVATANSTALAAANGTAPVEASEADEEPKPATNAATKGAPRHGSPEAARIGEGPDKGNSSRWWRPSKFRTATVR